MHFIHISAKNHPISLKFVHY